MHSKLVTIILGLLAALFGSLAGIQLVQDDLGMIFGAPPRAIGDTLYEFDVNSIHAIVVTNSVGEQAKFKKQNGAWIMTEPAHDRADYRDLQRIVYFSRHLRVEEVIRRRGAELRPMGLREAGVHPGRFQVDLQDKEGREVATYRLGRRTAWHSVDEEGKHTSQTFFVRPSYAPEKDWVYVCSSPDRFKPTVRQLFDRGFLRLRDHRPFLFDPTTVADLEIRHRDSELVLAREGPGSAWRMTKPLESRTKPKAIAQLLQGLYELEALAIHKKGGITIPPRPNGSPYVEISMRLFGPDGKRRERKITLTVEPPATESAATVYAEIDNRPGTIFELPFGPTKNHIALTQLPFAVDQLRSNTLASLNIAALDSMIVYDQKLSQPIRVFLHKNPRSGKPRWMLDNPGAEPIPANEVTVAALLKTVSQDEVVGFASDAANDLAPYGLAPPRKRLLLQGGEGETLDLWFGVDKDSKFYAMRNGTSTVMEISPSSYSAISTNPYDWHDTMLMKFSSIDLLSMRIERAIKPPLADPALTLNYDFLNESWTARQYGEDITTRLDTRKANKFIEFMEGIRVQRWLGPYSPPAEYALRKPVYRFTAVFQEIDDEGEEAGVRQVSFEIARATNSRHNKYYYGRISTSSSYFLLDRAAAVHLAESLIEEE